MFIAYEKLIVVSMKLNVSANEKTKNDGHSSHSKIEFPLYSWSGNNSKK